MGKGLITPDNLPYVIAALLSPGAAYFLKEAVKGMIDWRRGATQEDKNVLLDTLAQLKRCSEDRDKAYDERDHYRRQVARRDYLLLLNNITLPNDERGLYVVESDRSP